MTAYQQWALVVQIIAVIAALFLGAVALFREQLNAFFRPPILKIVNNNTPGALSKHENETLYMYYHLDVLNERRTSVAQDCKVILVAFQRLEHSGVWKEEKLLVPPYFYWAPMDNPSNPLMNIYDYRRFDFLILGEGGTYIGLRLNRPFHSVDWNIYAGQQVRYILQVEAKNGRSKQHIIQVGWNGKWTQENPEAISIHEVNE